MKILNLKHLLAVSSISLLMACGRGGNNDRTWSVYKADENSSSHSPLNQIDTSNVSKLKSAWTFSVSDLPMEAQPANSQSNPIIIDGIMYTTSAKRFGVKQLMIRRPICFIYVPMKRQKSRQLSSEI